MTENKEKYNSAPLNGSDCGKKKKKLDQDILLRQFDIR